MAGAEDRVPPVAAVPVSGEFTHADVLPAVARMMGRRVGTVDADQVPVQLERNDLRAVILLVVDGLGMHQLATTTVAPMLTAAARDQAQPGRSVLPSTTTTNLVSIGTGRAGGDHGILGYTMVLDDAVFNPLVWRIGLRGGGSDARARVVPEALVPRPTMFELLSADGVATTVVVHPDFFDSGLTRAGLRGGQRLGAEGLEHTLEVARAAVDVGDGPAIAYAHHPTIDTAGHLHGPHTPAWEHALAAVDRTLSSFVDRLPADVALVVTADHGMVAVTDDEVTGLEDGHPLLAGVRLVAGEPRMRTLVAQPGSEPATIAARVADALGERAIVTTTRDAIAAGWFGADVPADHATRLGDVVVASVVGSLPHARVDPHGGRLAGLHGALTDAERDVPMLVLTGR